MKYAHTNVVARDWERLAAFYEQVFECVRVPPVRSQSGAWLEAGTGVPGARLNGVHLRLPGFGDAGPTLEVYSYSSMEPNPPQVANRTGFGHIAFEVDDVAAVLAEVVLHGGAEVGRITEAVVPGKGRITFVYAADPEGNLIELQRWELDRTA
ncbi:VOC family protein [Longimicrobium terrae]|uniref:Putative enzyme related to lactoylglutathione lyase n=1 Tax=Longimicrobium terrae TaxID=1639882 RepID=A0A841GXY4_9BACT|nr:VOC family protein [Longimicrobium terrae]MBB4636220.1 putative enzyme related to lactoylglutathione lyase [Longimicrobium terrae]MBB6070615.1 putative enzyme related to lactoylglutathione lyase [Longimicrobium terrae]